MDQHQRNNIEALSEQLGSLRITEEEVLEEITEYIDNILTALALAAYNKTAQVVMLKNIVLGPG